MGKLYWSAVVLVLVSGVSLSVYLGFQNKSEGLLPWTEFQSAEQAYQETKSILDPRIAKTSLVFLGPHPQVPLHLQIVELILNDLRNAGPLVVILDPLMAERLPQLENLKADSKLDLIKNSEPFLNGLKEVPLGTKVVVISPNIYVTHFLQQSAVSNLKENLGGRSYEVLSFFNFPRSRGEEKDFEFPCHASASGSEGLDLGCLIQSQARHSYSKNAEKGGHHGFLNQAHSHELMFFLNE